MRDVPTNLKGNRHVNFLLYISIYKRNSYHLRISIAICDVIEFNGTKINVQIECKSKDNMNK